MQQLHCYPYELDFQYPFTTHKGTKTAQPTLIVSLTGHGMTGYGEAPAISYYDVTVAHMLEVLENKKAAIERFAITDPKRFWHFLYHLIPGEIFAIAALDIAAWDLFGKMSRKPVHQMLGITWGSVPPSDYTIGMDDLENMERKLMLHPAPVYKIKTGGPDDIDMIRSLRKLTTVPFRLDANEGWTFDDAKHLLPELKALGVTLIEQPLKRDEADAMKELKAISEIPLYADESCRIPDDVAHCADGFHGINIKLTKCGGITPAMEMIQIAKKLGLKIMLGSMNESTVGTAGIAQLLPMADVADLDGPLLLKEDVATGITYSEGAILLSGAAGTGIKYTGSKFLKPTLTS